ncbi:hypothetical protein HC031_16520 [Planosporangium thailandense]|uniref:Uncharacterized protein n=1 Tax=Planosporangium thailandense TaxID=765197 RepID=A0ABX0XZR2_9ACTN|nr:hypothetical protein [Planosporangium thailandense]NJC71306.1 hypothetical protein [Planosporangium thailandense]
MAENVELVIRFHPVGGDDVSLLSSDFPGPDEALDAIVRALDDRHSLILRQARDSRVDRAGAIVINLANVVSVRVSKTDSDTTGPYL